jgi:hypothetical protein
VLHIKDIAVLLQKIVYRLLQRHLLEIYIVDNVVEYHVIYVLVVDLIKQESLQVRKVFWGVELIDPPYLDIVRICVSHFPSLVQVERQLSLFCVVLFCVPDCHRNKKLASAVVPYLLVFHSGLKLYLEVERPQNLENIRLAYFHLACIWKLRCLPYLCLLRQKLVTL